MAEEWSSVQSTLLEVMACHNPALSTPTTLLVACRKPSGRLWWCLLVELRVLVHLVLPQICHATPQILYQLRCRPVGQPRMPTGIQDLPNGSQRRLNHLMHDQEES